MATFHVGYATPGVVCQELGRGQPSPAPPRLRGPMKGHDGRGQRRPSSLPILNLRALHTPEVARVHRHRRDAQRQCMRCNQAVAPLQLSSVPCASAWSAKGNRSVTAAAFARAKRETRNGGRSVRAAICTTSENVCTTSEKNSYKSRYISEF